MSPRSEEDPVDEDSWRSRVSLHYFRKGDRFGAEEKFIEVDEGDPAAASSSVAKAVVVDRLLFAALRWSQGHPSLVDPRSKHSHELIGAVVVVEKEVFDAHQAVELQPLFKVARLVLEDSAHAERPPLTCRQPEARQPCSENDSLRGTQHSTFERLALSRVSHRSAISRVDEVGQNARRNIAWHVVQVDIASL